jgi:hypothetical protein
MLNCFFTCEQETNAYSEEEEEIVKIKTDLNTIYFIINL